MAEDQILMNFNDVIADETPSVFSVSEVNSHIRQILEGEFHQLWIRGEISNFKPHTSGHFYFSLKDEGSQISAVMFRGHNSKLKFRPENGLEVLIKGKITVYEPRGNYQVFCETMEPVGAGALQKAFEQLKAKLQAEGLFAPERKRPLPPFPKHIGIVTSPTGAAIKDILNVLNRRYRSARITLVPVLVQGDPAPASIVAGIQMINRLKDVDVLIIGRGGGSIEDLWAFNDEKVARAIAASRIPTISAVGHEVDFTIADFVADLRAPTPSAAAELVARSALEILDRIRALQKELTQKINFELRSLSDGLSALLKRLTDPRRRLQDLQQRNDELSLRLNQSADRFFAERRQKIAYMHSRLGTPKELLSRLYKRLEGAQVKLRSVVQRHLDLHWMRLKKEAASLDAMSPLRVVDRGYSIVEKAGQIVTKTNQVQVGDEIQIRLSQGQLSARILTKGGPDGL